MVGVAGKSKGCTTCRRRKIRCGQETPLCLNCVRSGRSCEGYDRYPVFINRTAEGLQRRKPLEEAKTGSSDPGITTVASARAGFDPGLAARPSSSVATHLPSSPSSGAIWSAGFLSWFWEDYTPADAPSNGPPGGPSWLYLAMNIPHPTRALRQSLLALSVVRWGRAKHDTSLVFEGQRIYGHSIAMLQRAINDPQEAWHEETLAATRAMVLYEVRTSPIQGTIVVSVAY